MKRSFKDTAKSCEAQGFKFNPMVLEAHGGGWSPLVRNVIDWISKQQALVTNEEHAAVSLRVAQRMSCTLHRENSRAIQKIFGRPKNLLDVQKHFWTSKNFFGRPKHLLDVQKTIWTSKKCFGCPIFFFWTSKFVWTSNE